MIAKQQPYHKSAIDRPMMAIVIMAFRPCMAPIFRCLRRRSVTICALCVLKFTMLKQPTILNKYCRQPLGKGSLFFIPAVIKVVCYLYLCRAVQTGEADFARFVGNRPIRGKHASGVNLLRIDDVGWDVASGVNPLDAGNNITDFHVRSVIRGQTFRRRCGHHFTIRQNLTRRQIFFLHFVFAVHD